MSTMSWHKKLSTMSWHSTVSQNTGRDNSDTSEKSMQESIALGKAMFKRVKRWCKNNGSILLVTTTGWHDIYAMEGGDEKTKAFMDVADDFFRSLDVPFLDISDFVSEVRGNNREAYIFDGDGHPNEMGAELIARVSWNEFIRQCLADFCGDTKRCKAPKRNARKGTPLK